MKIEKKREAIITISLSETEGLALWSALASLLNHRCDGETFAKYHVDVDFIQQLNRELFKGNNQ